MDIQDLIKEAPAVISVVAAIGIALLVPLYLSQRRDVRRLRDWMEREPDHPARDIAASETLLDRAEAELEELLGTGPAEAEEPGSKTEAMPAAARVTSERPALERITMEREAIQPHRRWRRFAAVVTQPRVLVPLGLVAIAVGIGSIFLSQELLKGGDEPARPAAVNPADVTVTVLNGTAVSGLAQTVSGEIEAAGYQLGEVATATEPGFEKTVVQYAAGQKRAAKKVSRDLGINPNRVEPFDRDARLLAGDADVVVIAGEDRAQP